MKAPNLGLPDIGQYERAEKAREERQQAQDRADDENRHYINKILEARYAYWSALLTVNGFLLALFSVQAINESTRPWLTFALVVCAGTAIVLLLINFAVHHSQYMSIGPVRKRLPPKEQREKLRNRDKRRKKSTFIRQRVTEALLVTQIVIIGFLVWPKPIVSVDEGDPTTQIIPTDSTVTIDDTSTVVADSTVVDSL